MNQLATQVIPWGLALAVFLGTLPIFGAIVWNLVEVKSLRTRFDTEVAALRTELAGIRERLARIEQRLDDAHIGSALVTK